MQRLEREATSHRIKWELVELGPLTATGLDEVIMTGERKGTLMMVAWQGNFRVTGRHATHAVRRIPEGRRQ